MPVVFDFSVKDLSQDEFHEIDRMVMGHAFDIQNEIGRFYDEFVYKNELCFRCQSAGLDVLSEACMKVMHQDFEKKYYLDMLAGNRAVYELKAVDSLAGIHENQLLHYLFLLGLSHGKLINFSPKSVGYRFVSTQIPRKVCFNVQIDDSCWTAVTGADRLINEIIRELMNDWGGDLDVSLYKEALFYFLGDLSEKVYLLQPDSALHISAITRNHTSYRKHLERLFKHTCLTRIQWVNFNKNRVERMTLKK